MLKRGISQALILLAFPVLTVNAQGQSVYSRTYICERNVALQVAFIRAKDNSYAVVSVDGKLVPMRQDSNMASELFVAVDEQDSYRLHIKGNEAVLTYKDSEQQKAEKIIFATCQVDIEED